MGRKDSPSPEPSEWKGARGCAYALLGCSLFFAIVAVISMRVLAVKTWWLLVFALPAVPVLAPWGYGRYLLFRAVLKYRPGNVAGVLITSDSPHWNDYIRERWLERFGECLVVLNWSHRQEWDNALAARLFFHFCSFDKNRVPAFIYLRGLRDPLVFRFFYAFRDYKHGNDLALRALEARMFRELGLKDAEERFA